MGRLADIFRHPIKAHGAEALQTVMLRANACMPYDRHWAVVHQRSTEDGSRWARCGNFMRGASTPTLMALTASFAPESGVMTLSHPQLPPLQFDPDQDQQAFLDWIAPIIPDEGRQPAAIIRAQAQGMTDAELPSITLANHATRRALGDRLGVELAPQRFRSNLWLDELAPWQEHEWIGKRLRIGDCTLRVDSRVARCRATEANPETGHRDAPVLDALQDGWGHQDFSVLAVVETDGQVSLGDRIEVLS